MSDRDSESVAVRPKRITKAEEKRQESEKARQRLLAFLRPGQTVYTVLRSVSRSGMQRTLDAYAIVAGENGTPEKVYLSGYIAKAADLRRNDHGALVVGGCGMDVGFEVVYNLGRAVFPNGVPCTGESGPERCRSNDHTNGDRNYTKGRVHRDGGYAFRHEWI